MLCRNFLLLPLDLGTEQEAVNVIDSVHNLVDNPAEDVSYPVSSNFENIREGNNFL